MLHQQHRRGLRPPRAAGDHLLAFGMAKARHRFVQQQQRGRRASATSSSNCFFRHATGRHRHMPRGPPARAVPAGCRPRPRRCAARTASQMRKLPPSRACTAMAMFSRTVMSPSKAGDLERPPQPQRHAVGHGQAGDVLPASRMRPGVGGEFAAELVDQRGFARAVRADQRMNLARRTVSADMSVASKAAKALDQTPSISRTARHSRPPMIRATRPSAIPPLVPSTTASRMSPSHSCQYSVQPARKVSSVRRPPCPDQRAEEACPRRPE
jgi:hypothetical protein